MWFCVEKNLGMAKAACCGGGVKKELHGAFGLFPAGPHAC